MRIVIDMQGAQSTGSRHRGIGRYTLSLARAIIQNCNGHEVILALSGNFPDSVEAVRTVFRNLLPRENIRVWHAFGPLGQLDDANIRRRQAAELSREAFLASLKPSVVLISSLFEGPGDDSVTSVASLSQTVPTAAVLYDLIPLVNRSLYLGNPAVTAWYENKLAHLRRAGLVLAISESSRQEAMLHLGIRADAIVNISTAADPQFRAQAIGDEQQRVLRSRYGLKRPFVMYTGGIDHRKNIEGLIRAYAVLSEDVRQAHQIAVVCSIRPQDRARLEALATTEGLAQGDLVLTGYVPEQDLVALYNLCKVFVFPSWHEGFGLPALEAMACGSAVIGSNTSSVPEVIGCEDALFDPFDDLSIAAKLHQVLTDDDFRRKLEQRSLDQAGKFSWQTSAKLAIHAMEQFVRRQEPTGSLPCKTPRRPRLAYVSPLPPERSGISDYSAELLPELARHYEIDVVVDQPAVATPWIRANCPIRTVGWFREHAARFDRVLYHFGNSAFHQHMFSLLETVPGAVVLHDFYLSAVVAHMDVTGVAPGSLVQALYAGHGYAAVHHRFQAFDSAQVVWNYPCNLQVLQNAQGIIVHSEASRRLAQEWYGTNLAVEWERIPLPRSPAVPEGQARTKAREALGLGGDDFVVCSFGMLGPSKLNHRLLDVWLASPLAADERCVLVFVGENDGGEYGRGLLRAIEHSGVSKRIRITGWADTDAFRQYLMSADLGVQLRAFSRGETSGTVLDCMNHGMATIVNANGSMADLTEDCVWKLPDDFADPELGEALATLGRDAGRREQLGRRARESIRLQHSPRACADQYFSAVERFHAAAATGVPALSAAIAQLGFAATDSATLLKVADAIDRSIPQPLTQRQILVDVTGIVECATRDDALLPACKTLEEWLLNPPDGYRVEPVYASRDKLIYYYGRQFTLGLLNCPSPALVDEPIHYCAGDIFIGPDPRTEAGAVQEDFYRQLRLQGVTVRGDPWWTEFPWLESRSREFEGLLRVAGQ